MTRRVLIIRHCQSEANVAGLFESRGDSPLTEDGRAQAQRLARALTAHDLAGATLIASPLLRARHTAAAIAREHRLEVAHDERFLEGEVGWMEGMAFPAIVAHLKECGVETLTAEVHGGESLEDCGARLRDALIDHLERCEGTLVVVSHGYAIHALLHVLEHPPDGFPANGDITEIHFDEGRAALPPRRRPLGD